MSEPKPTKSSCCRSGASQAHISQTSATTVPVGELLTTTLLVNNIHCASCVSYAKEVLFVLPHIREVEVSILAHEVRVRHYSETSTLDLVKALVDAAFEVFHASTSGEAGTRLADLDASTFSPGSQWLDAGLRRPPRTAQPLEGTLEARKSHHIANCNVCRLELEAKSGADIVLEQDATPIQTTRPKDIQENIKYSQAPEPKFEHEMPQPTSESGDIVPLSGIKAVSPYPGKSGEMYDAKLSIGGMTCGSCANSVTSELLGLDFVDSAVVNILTNSAEVTYSGPKENIAKIIHRIEDIGYECRAEEVVQRPQAKNELYLANVSITGMTCSSCVGSITRAVEASPHVFKVTIDLLGNSGRIEFEGQDNLNDIISRINDLGYDATVIDCTSLAEDVSISPEIRVIEIRVDGMFCPNCPETVLDALQKIQDESLAIEVKPTLQRPIVKVSYIPNPSTISIRSIIAAIDSTNKALKASVYHPPTIEDRSRAMQRHEQKRLLLRLAFTFVVAIPVFLIGIVWMAIVPRTDRIRKYLEEPMWVGSVSRIEWALFIMTTPVMVFGTDVFHVRAFKEIRALWRPGSRVPLLRRFYRFGSMNMLISAGTSVSYFASLAVLIVNARTPSHGGGHTMTYFDTVVFLTLFILAGRALESYSKAKTGDAVASLGKLRPSEALLVIDSVTSQSPGGTSIQRVPIDLLEIGDIVSVPHGGSPPSDGLITGAAVYKFDESSLTGESKPVSKATGDKVYSGSVNVGQPVTIQITDLGSTSMLDQIVAVVREGQAKRAPVERVADAITGYFVPAITLVAILTFILWLALGESGSLPHGYMDSTQGGWPFWSLQFAIAVFVVACPCGLALAAPTALFVGGGLAAKRGILVRGGGEAFQEASRLNAIVFDKTGTLTEGGTLKVSDHEVLVNNEEEVEAVWALTKALEESSTHPIARAIVEFCIDRSSATVESATVDEISGKGMKGTFQLRHVKNADTVVHYEAAIGNQRLLESLNKEGSDSYYLKTLLSKYHSAGKSTAVVSIRQISPSPDQFKPALVFATSDPIRAEAPMVISELKSRGISVHMCTGDNATTAHAVAAVLGIPSSNIMANVLPSQKADYIKKVKNNQAGEQQVKRKDQKSIVAFVGDGTNDSPALAAADVSIAMASGSDVAVNAAGFILLNSDLYTILELCTLSRRVFSRVKWNFLWAAMYNVTLIPIAAGVLYPIVTGHKVHSDGTVVNTHWRLDPVWAALAMALSSLSVVLSSLALRLEFKAGVKNIWKRWF
ncbi:hypothetical protein FQN57_007068 [Myotisia sp. PD_48]|nr:hypothetical protein FQN57_007068 [Myotisia sp. PD_48]